MRITIEKDKLKFLFLLFAGDLLFILFHIGFLVTTKETDIVVQGNSIFALGKDMGLAETYQYVKEYWIAIMLAYMAWTKKEFMYLSWSVLAAYLMVDDFLQLHERLGRMVTDYFEMVPALSLRAQDFGELVFVALIGGFLLMFVALAYWKGSQKMRTIAHHFVMILISLVIFGVFFDMVQVMVLGNDLLFNIFGTIEDGGEMVIMSIFCWYVFYLTENEPLKITKKGMQA